MSTLVVATPPGHTALAYAGAAIASPLVIAVQAIGVCVGLAAVGILGTAALALLVTAAAVVMSSTEAVRRFLDGHFERRERAARESARLRKLRPAGAGRRQQYAVLRDLVDEVTRKNELDARRFELEDMLDQFADLCSQHQGCLESLRRAGTCDLPIAEPPAGRRSRRREILSRRIRHREECMRRVEELSDTIEAIDELIHLVAQRSACQALDGDVARDVDRRLWELDEVDAAIDQLSA
jgi:hypothetical protein